MKNNFSKKICLLVLFVIFAGPLLFAQKVTGVVSDESNVPIPGVNVVVKGTTNGVSTDLNGAYSITPGDMAIDVLIFSFIGFDTKELPVNGQPVLNVSLKSTTLELDEVVAIGYGTVKKRDLTGAVSSVKASEIVKMASPNALQSIQGKVAGLDITRSSGESGSDINVNLRGNRSVNASNTPLFLVDGIEYGSTIDINASDIESVEILKDASSTAIYGTRGANGVVIITTKRGSAKMGDMTRIAFNSYVSFNSPTNLPDAMDVEQEYLLLAERQRYAEEKKTNGWGTTNLANFPVEKVLSDVINAPFEKSLYDIYLEGGVNWYDMIMENSLSQNYEVSASGGTNRTAFNLSLGYLNEKGLLRNDNLKRYNARVNLDHNILDKLKVGTSIQVTTRDWDRRADNVYSQLIKMHALAQPYFSSGAIVDKPSELATSHTNPLLNEVPGYYANNEQLFRFFGNFYLDWEIIKGLKFKTILGVDQKSNRTGIYQDYMCTSNYQSGRGSNFEAENYQSMAYTWENTLNYTRKFGEVHDIQFLLGQSASKYVYESHGVSGIGLQDHYGKNSFYELSNILPGGRTIANEYTQKTMLSYFGRMNYKLHNKYLLTASLRADGSSVLAEGNKWGYFPSFSGAWVLSEESFMKNTAAINNLKIRLSWGKSGNSAVDPYKTLTVLGSDKIYYTYGTQVVTGQIPANLGNSDLTWETTGTYDIGFDISMLKSRISATIDLYYAQTSDLLLYKGLPATSVYPQVLSNVGETENKGFEIALNLKAIEKKDFNWNTDLTFSMNRDKIVSLASGAEKDISNPDQALVVGEPVRAFYNYEADGCWSVAEVELAKKFNRIPGDIKIVDQNSDGVINEKDKRIYNKSPKFIFGWNNAFSYKGISLSALIYARQGQWIQYDFNTAYKPIEQDGSPNVDYWTPENQGAKFPRPGIASQNDIPAIAFENASFLKIKELTLGYLLPKKVIAKAGMNKFYFYCSMQNYFNFSNLNNYDPERGGAISNPLSKQVVLGVNIEF